MIKFIKSALKIWKQKLVVARIHQWTARKREREAFTIERSPWMMCAYRKLEEEARKVHQGPDVVILHTQDTFGPVYTALKWADMSPDERHRWNCEQDHDREIRTVECRAIISDGRGLNFYCRVFSVREGVWEVEEGSVASGPIGLLPAPTLSKVVRVPLEPNATSVSEPDRPKPH